MRTLKLLTLFAILGLLSACQEKDDKPLSTTVQVTPSLGLIQNATVELLSTDGRVLDSKNTGARGVVSFKLASDFKKPFLLRICGGDGVSYFDEGLNDSAPLAQDQCLRSLVPDSSRGELAITAFTEALVRRVEREESLAAVSAEQIEAKAAVLGQLLLPGGDILRAPELVGDADQLKALLYLHTGAWLLQDTPLVPGQSSMAGVYAYRLATLARAAVRQAHARDEALQAPAYAAADALAQDLSDGLLDGQVGLEFIVAAAYDVFHVNYHLLSALLDQIAFAAGQPLFEGTLALSEVLALLVERGLPQPFFLSLTSPERGDALLSWQGVYNGSWALGDGVDMGKSFAYLLPEAYQQYMTQLQEGGACQVIVSDGVVWVSGLSFVVGYQLHAEANEAGLRQFALRRVDEGFVTVVAEGVLSMQGDKVLGIDFQVKAANMMMSMNANLSCKLAEAILD